MTTRLKVLVPIYVVLTKVDLVAGFTECWDDLRRSERGQIWGATFPLDNKLEPRAAFEEEFDLLVKRLHARTIRRMGTERNLVTRRAVLQFPVEIASLKDNIARLIEVLFEKNPFQETARCAGCTSRAERRTSGRLRASSRRWRAALRLRGFSQRLDTQQASAVLEAKSFFLTDLFFKVMFPDQHVAGKTEGERRRQLLMRVVFAGVAVMIAAGLVVPAGCTFVRNRELVRSTAEISRTLETTSWDDRPTTTDGSGPTKSDRLLAAEERVRQLDGWRQDPPVQLRWGMYTGHELYEGLRDVYVAAITRAVISQARADLEDHLRGIDSAPVRSSDNFNRDFDTLKLYLMLGEPEHMDPEWAAPRIVRQWELMSHAHAKGEGETFAPHVLFVSELLKRGEITPWKTDPRIVTRARSILAQVPQLDRLYETLVRDANSEIASIRREAIFYGSVGPFVKSRSGVKVPGAYTKQGWLRVKALLGTEGAKLTAERWVLGEDEAQVGQAIDKLRDLYFERYKNAWRDFLGDLEIADPGNAEYALAELNAMSEPEWPYLRLIRILGDNVTLDSDDGESSLVQKATDKAKELLDAGAPKKRTISPVERAFRPIVKFGVPPETKDGDPPATGLSQWEALVAKLVGALTDFRDGAASADPKAMSDVFQEAFRTTSSLLSEQDGFTRPLLSPLLMQPITLAWANIVKDAGVAAGATWEVAVWPKWHEKLEGKYPFVASRTDASLEDFLGFFGAGEGSLWAFYSESLKATLD